MVTRILPGVVDPVALSPRAQPVRDEASPVQPYPQESFIPQARGELSRLVGFLRSQSLAVFTGVLGNLGGVYHAAVFEIHSALTSALDLSTQAWPGRAECRTKTTSFSPSLNAGWQRQTGLTADRFFESMLEGCPARLDQARVAVRECPEGAVLQSDR